MVCTNWYKHLICWQQRRKCRISPYPSQNCARQNIMYINYKTTAWLSFEKYIIDLPTGTMITVMIASRGLLVLKTVLRQTLPTINGWVYNKLPAFQNVLSLLTGDPHVEQTGFIRKQI